MSEKKEYRVCVRHSGVTDERSWGPFPTLSMAQTWFVWKVASMVADCEFRHLDYETFMSTFYDIRNAGHSGPKVDTTLWIEGRSVPEEWEVVT